MRLQDGGFESGGIGAPWILSGSAAFAQDPNPVHAGLFSMLLSSSRARIGSQTFLTSSGLAQIIATTPGELIAVSSWFYADAGAVGKDQPLTFFADGNPGDGSGLVPIESITPSGVGGLTWVPHIHPAFTAGAAQAYLYWLNSPPTSNGSTAWFMDDAQVVGDEDVAKRSRWLAHQRLVQVLKGINGAAGGYHVDIGNRAFTKYLRPVGSTHPAFPYLCVPLVNSAPRIEHETTFIKHTWTIPIMAFVAEPNVGAFDSDGLQTLYHIEEDVFRAVMLDPTLNNTVQAVSFVSGGIEEAGVSPFDGLPYCDAVIPIDLSIYLGLDVLGP